MLEHTLEYLNQLATLRGYKQGPMMDKVIEEYKNPNISYLLDRLIDRLPHETYFTTGEMAQLNQLVDLIRGIDHAKQV